MKTGIRKTLFALLTLSVPAAPALAQLTLYDGGDLPAILHGPSRTEQLAATMLGEDLAALTGRRAREGADLSACGRLCVVVAVQGTPLADAVAVDTGAELGGLKDGWERYHRAVLPSKTVMGRVYLLIAGSDRRGAVYGAVDLSRELGISPWSWWADVRPARVSRLAVAATEIESRSPAIRYRGIFLNDEDWGLEPWAAKTLDPASGTIGHKTYERVFQLMWRLKADLIWPAMHSVSAPFYADPENPRLADDYAIMVGTSHAEPMMRNNVREWDAAVRGPFDFTRNQDGLTQYWRERIAETSRYEGIYTVGLRGIHDGPMQGADTAAERAAILARVTEVQRGILARELNRPIATIPQALTIYKEVEEAYNTGVSLPDDITLIWCDDNYGYIGRLSGDAEARRSGGSGIYYHLSYWGRPHDYLWLATTHPGLIREEMGRAYDADARRLWVVNVGDIKPGEYLTQYFLDLAFDADWLGRPPSDHLTRWMEEQFGEALAGELSRLMMRYYDLAFERRPEFMGWGQTEPVTPNHASGYVRSDGEEARRRLDAYDALRKEAERLALLVPARLRDAYFQLVLYPVRGAASLNERILSLDLAGLYARQGRASANFYAARAEAAHGRIVEDAARYNSQGDGKWRHMMDPAPRDLPVFQEPIYPRWSASKRGGCGLAFSGQWAEESNALIFTRGRPEKRVLTLFGRKEEEIAWRVETADSTIRVPQDHGRLERANFYESRIEIAYDGGGGSEGMVFRCGAQRFPVTIRYQPPPPDRLPSDHNRIIALPLPRMPDSDLWQAVPELGSQGMVLRSRLDLASIDPAAAAALPALSFDFFTGVDSGASLVVSILPTHPATPAHGLRLGVSLDDGPMTVLDYETQNRSDQWRQDVLANRAQRNILIRRLVQGRHRLRLFPLDPGVMLDAVEIDLDGAVVHYGDAPLIE